MAEFRKWRIDMDGNEAAIVEKRHVPSPPGYNATVRDLVASTSGTKSAKQLELRQQALFSRATGQLKTVGFLAFMMWMSGSQIHLFSIMMTVSGIYQPLMAIVKSGEAFPAESSEDGKLDVLKPRLLYCLIQGAGLAFALWKVNGMGLLPTHPSDFVSALSIPRALELAMPGHLL